MAAAAAPKKVFKSTVVVAPDAEQDAEFFAAIQEIRKTHDKAFKRWPPHINMLWPFHPEPLVAASAEKLRARLATVEPFTLTFDRLSYFQQKQACTVHLAPTSNPPGALQALQAIMVEVFPECTELSTRSPHGFTPHLTLAQYPNKAKTDQEIATIMKTWKPFTLLVDKVYIMTRGDETPFTVKEVVHLKRD
eukprot:m.132272 g.132272  ORF g.132272 m.132272 type:complete len:192 (+) comp20059_c0_seq1:122-697(+)